MAPRARRLWLPGLVALLLSFAIRTMLDRFRIDEFHVHVTGVGHILRLPWLGSLFGVGALAAFLSRRAGGRPWQRLLAAWFPALLEAALLLGRYLVAPRPPHPYLISPFQGFMMTTGWPLVALTLGSLPFLRTRREPTVIGSAA